MAGVKLKLNPEETEFIIIGDRQARESLINKFPTQLLGNSISPTDTVKNLFLTPETPLLATLPICVAPVTTTLRT